MTDTATIDRASSGNPAAEEPGRGFPSATGPAEAAGETKAPEPVAAKVVSIASGRAAPEPALDASVTSCDLAAPLQCARARGADRQEPCPACGQTFADTIPIGELQIGKIDRMQNTVLEIYWASSTFKVYRTARGVFAHFADCGRLERAQRAAFDALYAPMSSLRFLTSRMFRFRANASSFYDHETAQAVVQALHGRIEPAVATLNQLHDLALDRVANENRVRYLMACVATGLASGAAGVLTLWLLSTDFTATQLGAGAGAFRPYVLAAIMGGLGAVFSIAMSVRSLEMMPCQHSFMNYVIGALRVLTGFISGGMLVLLLTSNLLGDLGEQLADGEGAAKPLAGSIDWAKVAMLGLLAGFAERMVPDLMGGASSRVSAYRDKAPGVPAQAAKDADTQAPAKP